MLRNEPAWDALPPGLSPVAAVYLRRCLQKDPGQRIHDVADLRLALEGDAAKPVKDKFEVAALPTVMLMGPDGKLLAIGTQLRGDGLETTLLKVLK